MSNKLTIAIVIIITLGTLGYFAYQFMPTAEAPSLIPENEAQNNQNSTSTGENTFEPYIKIVSPNGKDLWKIGETYDATWQSFGVESVDIILENWDKMEGTFPSSILIVRDISASLEKYSFVLSEKKLPAAEEKIGTHFKLRIVAYPLDYTISDRSDDFFSVQNEEKINQTAKSIELEKPPFLK